MNILIVDDQPSNRKLMRAVLEAEGATVSEAADGVEALGVMERLGVDAVISDLLMPRMDGYRLCQEVRASLGSRDVPFIAYSAADTSPGDEERIIAMGADRVLPKPASAAVVAGVLDEVVRTRGRRPAILTRGLPDPNLRTDQRDRWAAKIEARNFELEMKLRRLAQAASDRQKTHERVHHSLALVQAVTTAIIEAPSLCRMTQKVMETIGRGLEWDLGEWWTVDPAGKVLRCIDTWQLPATPFRDFAAASLSFVISRGPELPAQVWATGAVMSCPDLTQPPGSSRHRQAGRIGLRTWIGFPVKVRKEVVAVVGFFSRKMTPPDAGLLDTFGLQIGQFLALRRLADQFRLTQRTETLGRLAGGIAHDFNNILTGIGGYCTLARAEVPSDPALTRHLDGLMAGVQRASALVGKILDFAHHQTEERKAIQLWPVVTEALRLLRVGVPPAVEFRSSPGKEVPSVFADATQIHQIVMNLGINAAHAMRTHGGHLNVALDNFMVDASFATTHSALRIGRHARLTVSDDGEGMDAETVQRVFEPFFTTKPLGEGTGIGLAVVRDIVESHEGAITVSSQPGRGTVFHIYFPAHKDCGNESTAGIPSLPRGAGQRILFVDDEVGLVDVGEQVLNCLGYRTDACANADQALELIQRDPAAYALVITDQTMPGLTGVDLAQRIKAICPGLPVILATGETDGIPLDRLRSMGITQLLVKPISMPLLAEAVHQVLVANK